MSTLAISRLQMLVKTARAIFDTNDLIIGGGAPRDLLSGVAVKDIDIFVKQDPEDIAGEVSHFTAACKRFATLLGGEAVFRPAHPNYPNIFDLCDIESTRAHGVVQVIGLDDTDPIDDVNRYDFDLSQVFITPGGLYGTEAAWKARAARAITYTPSDLSPTAAQRSKARLGRLRAKYADWTFVGCEALDALEATEPDYSAVSPKADDSEEMLF